MTNYSVDDLGEMDSYAGAVELIAGQYSTLSQQVMDIGLPEGSAGRVRRSPHFEQAARDYAAGLRDELQGAALGSAYFSGAVSTAAAYYRETDQVSSDMFEELMAYSAVGTVLGDGDHDPVDALAVDSVDELTASPFEGLTSTPETAGPDLRKE